MKYSKTRLIHLLIVYTMLSACNLYSEPVDSMQTCINDQREISTFATIIEQTISEFDLGDISGLENADNTRDSVASLVSEGRSEPEWITAFDDEGNGITISNNGLPRNQLAVYIFTGSGKSNRLSHNIYRFITLNSVNKNLPVYHNNNTGNAVNPLSCRPI